MKPCKTIALLPLLLTMAAACGPAVASVPTAGLPASPGLQATVRLPATTTAPASVSGAVSGHLSYPSEVTPELRVAAFDATDASRVAFVDTVPNQSVYRIGGLQPGRYHVVAYVLDPASVEAGGYSRAVTCGLSAGCTDHALLDVVVASGQTVENVDPQDWYAPAGTFPPRPGP